jgi:hypothetical protein
MRSNLAEKQREHWLSIETVERRDAPGAWTVEAIEEQEGRIFQTTFHGPDSKERAREYARWKYGQ